MTSAKADPQAVLAIRPRRRIIRAAEARAWQDGEAFLASARQAADMIRAQAVAAFEAERRRGFEEGRRAGATEAARLLAETTLKIDRALAGAAGEIADLAIDALERLLGDFDQRDLLVRAVRHAIAQLRHAKRLRLRVAPAVVDDVKARLGADLDPESLGLVAVEGDAALEGYAAVLVSDAGFVEVGIAAQIEALRLALGVKPATPDAAARAP
jgi:type III secretion protein L